MNPPGKKKKPAASERTDGPNPERTDGALPDGPETDARETPDPDRGAPVTNQDAQDQITNAGDDPDQPEK